MLLLMLPKLRAKVQVVYHVQCLHGRDAVYVHVSQLLHYVVGRRGAEQRYLLWCAGVGLVQNAVVIDIYIRGFQLVQYILGSLYHFLRQSRKPRHLYAEALVCAAADYLAQEDYVVSDFLYGYPVVLYALQLALKLRKLMVVGREQRLRAAPFLICDVLSRRL